MLTNSSKISDITNRDLFQINSARVIKKYDKRTAMQIWAVCVPFNMLTAEGCSETLLFRHLTNHAFRSL